jgi:hypothetical protein
LLAIVYWLLKSAVAAVRVTFTVPLPVSVPAPLITLAAAGVNPAPLATVIVLTTAKLVDVVTPAPLIVRLP